MKVRLGIILILLVIFASSCQKMIHKNHFLYPKSATYRLVTYNLNTGQGVWKITAPHKTSAVILKTQADMVLLQEVTTFWKNYLTPRLKTQFPYQEYRTGAKGGLAILSKYPFKTILFNNPKIGWHPGWIIFTKTPLGVLQISNFHLTPPVKSEGKVGFLFKAFFNSKAIRLREIKYFFAQLKPNIPTIIAGDFNEGNADAATKFIRNQGFLDAFRVRNFSTYTWLWSVGCLVLNEQLDHVFYSPDLHLTNIQVLHEGDSDHYPLIADFGKNKELWGKHY